MFYNITVNDTYNLSIWLKYYTFFLAKHPFFFIRWTNKQTNTEADYYEKYENVTVNVLTKCNALHLSFLKSYLWCWLLVPVAH